MTRRVLERGVAVFSPQLMLWNMERFGPSYDRKEMDKQLKQLGSSITAIEIYKIKRSVDHLLQRTDIDASRLGMIGLSYGGFYTLFTTASDLRIKVAVSSCFVNDRFAYDWMDWTWFNAGNTFRDAEVCALICPRPLYIEAGDEDELFEAKSFVMEAETAPQHYGKLKLEEKFVQRVFMGKHELSKESDPIDLLFKYL